MLSADHLNLLNLYTYKRTRIIKKIKSHCLFGNGNQRYYQIEYNETRYDGPSKIREISTKLGLESSMLREEILYYDASAARLIDEYDNQHAMGDADDTKMEESKDDHFETKNKKKLRKSLKKKSKTKKKKSQVPRKHQKNQRKSIFIGSSSDDQSEYSSNSTDSNSSDNTTYSSTEESSNDESEKKKRNRKRKEKKKHQNKKHRRKADSDVDMAEAGGNAQNHGSMQRRMKQVRSNEQYQSTSISTSMTSQSQSNSNSSSSSSSNRRSFISSIDIGIEVSSSEDDDPSDNGLLLSTNVTSESTSVTDSTSSKPSAASVSTLKSKPKPKPKSKQPTLMDLMLRKKSPAKKPNGEGRPTIRSGMLPVPELTSQPAPKKAVSDRDNWARMTHSERLLHRQRQEASKASGTKSGATKSTGKVRQPNPEVRRQMQDLIRAKPARLAIQCDSAPVVSTAAAAPPPSSIISEPQPVSIHQPATIIPSPSHINQPPPFTVDNLVVTDSDIVLPPFDLDLSLPPVNYDDMPELESEMDIRLARLGPGRIVGPYFVPAHVPLDPPIDPRKYRR